MFIKDRIKTLKLITNCALDNFQNIFPNSECIIQGSYNTGNIGDRAIGETIKNILINRFKISAKLTGYYYPLQNFRNYNLHIIGGGGIIHDLWKGNIEKRLRAFGTAKKNVVLGVGVPGFKTKFGKNFISKLKFADLITVRDNFSKEILSNYLYKKRIHVTACPAFLMNPSLTKVHLNRNHKKVCGISLRNIKKHHIKKHTNLENQKSKYMEFIFKNIDYLQNKFYLLFIPFTPEDYAFANKHLKDKFNIEILNLQNPELTLNTINNVDIMICMRYHSLVFSLIAEKPIFVISYAPKTDSIVDEFDLPSIKINYLKGNEKIKFCKNKEDIIKAKSILKERSMKNFYLLKKILI